VKSTVIEDSGLLHGAKTVIQTLKGGAFRPNILFLTVGGNRAVAGGNSRSQSVVGTGTGEGRQSDDTLTRLVSYASARDMGVVLLRQHPRMAFGVQQDVNVWLRDRSPNWHLALLVALQLNLNWGGKLNLVTAAHGPEQEKRLYTFLERLSDQARLPAPTALYVLPGPFKEALAHAPRADVNIFGLSLAGGKLPMAFIREVPDLVNTSSVFVVDSGQESALV